MTHKTLQVDPFGFVCEGAYATLAVRVPADSTAEEIYGLADVLEGLDPARRV